MNKHILWAILPVGLSFGAVCLAATPWKLSVDDAVTPTSARVINGVTYLPVRDVARAFGVKVSVSGTTITFVKPAAPKLMRPAPEAISAMVAAPPIDLSQGSMGQDLRAQNLGFRVVEVQRTRLFAAQHRTAWNRRSSYDAENGEDLAVVTCRLQNRGAQVINFAFPQGVFALGTALFDRSGGSYRLIGTDVAAQQGDPPGKTIAPGGTLAFNLIFRVPDDAQLKELSYSAIVYGEVTNNKSTDFNVDLTSSRSSR